MRKIIVTLLCILIVGVFIAWGLSVYNEKQNDQKRQEEWKKMTNTTLLEEISKKPIKDPF